MAERVGFEPTVPLLAEHTISSRAPSASSVISPFIRRAHSAKRLASLFIVPGGEGGIRTHVRAFGPQVDFESTPLRPLRYLSGNAQINLLSAESAKNAEV